MKRTAKEAAPAVASPNRGQRGVRVFALIAALLLIPMLYRFWFGESGWFAARELERQIAAQERETALQEERNRALTMEVLALKNGAAGVEGRARTDLGMVAEGETFYLVVETPPPATDAP